MTLRAIIITGDRPGAEVRWGGIQVHDIIEQPHTPYGKGRLKRLVRESIHGLEDDVVKIVFEDTAKPSEGGVDVTQDFVQFDLAYPRSDLVGKLVGYIIISFKSGQFLPRVGSVHDSPGDKDAVLRMEALQPPCDTLEAALACFDGEGSDGLAHVFRNPVSSNRMGLTWLSELVAAEAAPPVLVHQGA